MGEEDCFFFVTRTYTRNRRRLLNMAATNDILLIVIHHWRKYENHITVISSRLRISFLNFISAWYALFSM